MIALPMVIVQFVMIFSVKAHAVIEMAAAFGIVFVHFDEMMTTTPPQLVVMRTNDVVCLRNVDDCCGFWTKIVCVRIVSAMVIVDDRYDDVVMSIVYAAATLAEVLPNDAVDTIVSVSLIDRHAETVIVYDHVLVAVLHFVYDSSIGFDFLTVTATATMTVIVFGYLAV